MNIVHHDERWGDLFATTTRLREEHEAWSARLANDGLLLFRGFDVPDASSFARFARALTELSPYLAGQTDREARGADLVYESTRLPGLWPLTLHNEMSYSKIFPRQLLFHVEQRRCMGGASWFADTAAIAAGLPDALRQRLSAGVRYVRLLPPAHSRVVSLVRATRSGALKSWQASLNVHTRQQADALLTSRGVPFTWRGEWLDLTCTLPAFRDERWFNQLHTVHIHRRVHGRAAVALARAVEQRLGFAPLDATFADGSPFSPTDLASVHQAMLRARFAVDTRRHDVLWFDNLLVAHGRAPYLGTRRVNVAFSGLA